MSEPRRSTMYERLNRPVPGRYWHLIGGVATGTAATAVLVFFAFEEPLLASVLATSAALLLGSMAIVVLQRRWSSPRMKGRYSTAAGVLTLIVALSLRQGWVGASVSLGVAISVAGVGVAMLQEGRAFSRARDHDAELAPPKVEKPAEIARR